MKNIFISGFLIVMLLSCERWDIKPVNTLELPQLSCKVITTNGTSLACQGTIIDSGTSALISRGFCLSLDSTPSISDSINVQLNNSENFDITINNLIPDTTYYIVAYARNHKGLAISNTCKLKTSRDPLIPFNPHLSYGYLTDVDGNTYKTIKIGNQTWMAENLRVTHYQNGDSIPLVMDYYAWTTLKKGAQCRYDYSNSLDTIAKYGRYYNWYAIMDQRNIAPAGWHVPTIQEWLDLENYLSTNGYKSSNDILYKDITKSLATTNGWFPEKTFISVGFQQYKNNKSGFSALPAGYMSPLISQNRYKTTEWWCYCPDTTNIPGTNYTYVGLNYTTNTLSKGGGIGTTSIGISIRCIKDK
jgi:uncharacterized protein (TIGR02145 family)